MIGKAIAGYFFPTILTGKILNSSLKILSHLCASKKILPARRHKKIDLQAIDFAYS